MLELIVCPCSWEVASKILHKLNGIKVVILPTEIEKVISREYLTEFSDQFLTHTDSNFISNMSSHVFRFTFMSLFNFRCHRLAFLLTRIEILFRSFEWNLFGLLLLTLYLLIRCFVRTKRIASSSRIFSKSMYIYSSIILVSIECYFTRLGFFINNVAWKSYIFRASNSVWNSIV